MEQELGFATGVAEFASGKRVSDGEKTVSDALHGGDDDADAGSLRGVANEARGVEHAIGTEQRAAAELEGDNVARLLEDPAGGMHSMVQSGGAAFSGYIFLSIFKTHGLRSCFVVSGTAAGAPLEGV
jgi:hypothetical protein